jgi:transposase
MSLPPRKPYPTDLSDKEWTILEPLVPAVKVGGRPACWERREIANANFYVTRSGGTWRQLPHDYRRSPVQGTVSNPPGYSGRVRWHNKRAEKDGSGPRCALGGHSVL